MGLLVLGLGEVASDASGQDKATISLLDRGIQSVGQRYSRETVALASPVVPLVQVWIATEDLVSEVLLLLGELRVGLAGLQYGTVLHQYRNGASRRKAGHTLNSMGTPVLPIFSMSSG